MPDARVWCPEHMLENCEQQHWSQRTLRLHSEYIKTRGPNARAIAKKAWYNSQKEDMMNHIVEKAVPKAEVPNLQGLKNLWDNPPEWAIVQGDNNDE